MYANYIIVKCADHVLNAKNKVVHNVIFVNVKIVKNIFVMIVPNSVNNVIKKVVQIV